MGGGRISHPHPLDPPLGPIVLHACDPCSMHEGSPAFHIGVGDSTSSTFATTLTLNHFLIVDPTLFSEIDSREFKIPVYTCKNESF